jgi:hypothetical protein
MKERTEKKLWNFAALFTIMLVLTLPVYSAQSLAAVNVQITKNHGESGVENYLDAEGDVWTVEAIISGDEAGDVNPEDLVVKIGGNEAQFESCTDSPLGTMCEYISPLTDGIKENTYNFLVVYKFLDVLGYSIEKSNGDVIHADGSAPIVTGMEFNQNVEDGNVDAEFIVNDKFDSKPSIGIKTVEVIDADTNTVLQTFGPFEIGLEKFVYSSDSNTGGQISGSLFSGEGLKRIKVRAEDHLGHTKTSPAHTFSGDFVKPVISDLELTDFGKFIGQYNYPSNIQVNIREDNGLSSVKAYSDQADLDGEENQQNCESDSEEDGLYICKWSNVEVSPESSVSVKIIAKDEFGNVAETTLSQSFTSDTAGPSVDFFGTERVFEGKSYIKSNKQRIILEVSEQGSGILTYNSDGEVTGTKGIAANLGTLVTGGSYVKPSFCNETSAGAKCYWDTTKKSLNDGSMVITLSTFEDNVGNDGIAEPVELIIDSTKPKVKRAAIYGNSASDEHNYFQGNDQLKLEFEIEEISGLFVLVDISDVVNSAENNYPENAFSRGLGEGWQVFTEKDCTREEGTWKCEFYTDTMMSGPAENLEFSVIVQDTAGNAATVWPDKIKNIDVVSGETSGEAKFEFDLLGISTETNPDYWSVVRGYPKIKPGVEFVDMETAELTYARMPFNLRLSSENSRAKILAVEMLPNSCVPYTDTYSTPLSVSQREQEDTAEAAAETPAEEPVEEAAALAGSATETPDEADEAITAPEISRALIYGGNFPEGASGPLTVNMILEFAPFNARETFGIEDGDELIDQEVDYMCQLRIYSEVESLATSLPELEEVKVTVPFGYSELGLRDENIDKKIKDIKNDIWFQIPDKLKLINKILQWVRYLGGIVSIATGVYNIIQAFTPGDDGYRYDFPVYTAPLATAICGVKGEASESTLGVIEKAQMVVQILSCNPAAYSGTWYGDYQQSVLNTFNLWNNLGTTKAVSLYDNIWTSLFGLCLPGVVHNLEKLRQIKCTQINCLENFVPQGISTISGCQRMADILECKYVWGELVGNVVPLTGLFSAVKDLVKSIVTNPIGLIRTGIVYGCSFSMCGETSTGSAFCNYAGVGVYLLDIVDNILGLIDRYPTMSQDYCSQVGEGGWI